MKGRECDLTISPLQTTASDSSTRNPIDILCIVQSVSVEGVRSVGEGVVSEGMNNEGVYGKGVGSEEVSSECVSSEGGVVRVE